MAFHLETVCGHCELWSRKHRTLQMLNFSCTLSLEPAGFRGEKSRETLSTNEVFNEREALSSINDGLQSQTSEMPHLILPGSSSWSWTVYTNLARAILEPP